MPEGLQTPDGKPVDAAAVEQEFARAMSAPATDALSPPKKPQGDDAEPAKPRRGRPPKSEQPRVTSDAPTLSQAEQDAVKARRVKNVAETAGMLAGGLLVASTITGNDGFKADAYTFQAAAPQLADAAAEVARYDPVFARFIDKSGGGKITAYLGMATVALSLGSQLAANHGMVKPGFLNTASPADVITHYETPPEAPADGDAAQQE